MGSKGSQSQTTDQNQTYSADPRIQSAATQALTGAQGAAAQPFQMPTAPVAGFNPFQQQAFGQVQGMQGMAQPYFDQGQQYLQQSAAPITAGDVNQYYNPMAANVTAQMKNIFGQQQQATTGQLTQAAGGVGADRIAVGQSELANQQGLAAGQTYAGLYQQALQAAQQQKQMSAGAGYGISQLGPAAQNASLAGSQALGGAGNQQQAQQQAQLNAPYQNILAQIAYPFQTSQYLAGIAGGLAPALGGTTNGQSTTTQSPPSPWAQALGIGTGAVGIAGGLGAFDGMGTGKGGSAGPMTGIGSGALGAGASYFRRGGGIKFYADGGAPDDAAQPLPFPGASLPKIGGASPIPNISLPMGGGEFHNNLKMQAPAQSGSPGGGGASGLGTALSMAAMFLKRGGKASSGGAVNPYDFGQGFDEGGEVGDDDESLGLKMGQTPQPHFTMGDVTRAAGNYYFPDGGPKTGWGPVGAAMAERWGGENQPSSDMTTTEAMEGGQPFPGASSAPATSPSIASPAQASGSDPYTYSPDSWPQATSTPAPAPNPATQTIPLPGGGGVAVNTDAPGGGGRGRRGGAGSVQNADLSADDYMMPKTKQPYPDATDRDWGQKFARSPWMSLVKAGAAMAQTRGPIGSVIGAGMGAGAGALDSQRKELRSEQDINQKAQALYQQAKIHLDKYQRKTPHEVATEAHQAQALAQGKYQVINYTDPETGALKVGRFDTKHGTVTDPATGLQVNAGRVFGRSAASGPTFSGVAGVDKAVRSDPLWMAKPEAQIQAEINRRVQSIPAGTGGQHMAPAAPANNIPPMPSDKSQLKTGQPYMTSRGPAIWDGTKFVQQ